MNPEATYVNKTMGLCRVPMSWSLNYKVALSVGPYAIVVSGRTFIRAKLVFIVYFYFFFYSYSPESDSD